MCTLRVRSAVTNFCGERSQFLTDLPNVVINISSLPFGRSFASMTSISSYLQSFSSFPRKTIPLNRQSCPFLAAISAFYSPSLLPEQIILSSNMSFPVFSLHYGLYKTPLFTQQCQFLSKLVTYVINKFSSYVLRCLPLRMYAYVSAVSHQIATNGAIPWLSLAVSGREED
jgi:hypothetical protein